MFCNLLTRTGLLILAGLLMFGCASRGEFAVVSRTVPDATVLPVFVATNRTTNALNEITVGRARDKSYQRYDVSIPPNREEGRIQWPGATPDPSQDFVTTKASQFPDDAAFLVAIRRDLAALPAGSRDVVLFVHGYNTNMAEGVYRLAQMKHDLVLNAVPVYFSWPTAESVFGYVHDRDSVLYSRDHLKSVLLLLRRTGADRVIVMAHSMGGLLTAEVMRQAELDKPGSVPELFDSLIMMSPDIDEDVAIAQLEDLSRLPNPFIVFTSNEDRALRLATRISGNNARLGRGADVERFGAIDITFLDVTAFNERNAGDFGHLTLGSSQALIALVPQLRKVAQSLDFNIGASPGFVPGTVFSIQRATKVVLKPVAP